MKAGLIGCGHASKWRHIPSLLAIPSVALVSVCDIDKDRAEQTAKQYGIANYYTDAEEMLKKEALELVHIVTPPQTHHALTMLALENGSNVLVEKPFVYTVSEADEIIQKAKEKGLKITAIHNDLYKPGFYELKQRVAKGEIGDVTSVQYFYGFRDQSSHPAWFFSMYGSRFGETLPHPLCMILEFIDKPEIKYVKARKLGHCITPPDLDEKYYDYDEFHIELSSENSNAVGYIDLSFNSDIGEGMRVSGTKGSLFYGQTTTYESWLFKATRPWTLMKKGVSMIPDFLSLVKGKVTSGNKIKRTSHYIQIDKFVKSIINDTEPPVTGQEAREVVRLWQEIIEAIYDNPESS